jgi:dienelactone hydrolase
MFPDTGKGRVCFHKNNSGPPVIVLHEILGLEDPCFELGNRLHDEGFSVTLPLLFGKIGGHGFLGGYLRSCGSRQFSCAAREKASAILPWVGSLCDDIGRTERRPVGVVGMCLTGAFPLWLLRSEAVTAPVLCQPTMPFSLFGAGDAASIGLDLDDLRPALERPRVPVLGLRFTRDWRCPPQRFERLRALFGRRFEALEIPSGVNGVDEDAHSVLVGSYKATGPTRDAFRRTVEFLTHELGRL